MTDAHSAPSHSVAQRQWLKWLPILHLILSLVIASGIALLVTVFWFPSPFHQIGGGMRLFWVMLGVDMVCGPLLTWILIRPGKTWRALGVDLALIAFLQWGALGYGVYALAQSRPLAVVHEVDRFRVISYSDVPEEKLKDPSVPAWFTPWSLDAPRMLGLSRLSGLDAKMASVEAAFQGVDAAQQPARWQDYSLNKADILRRARPVEQLRTRYPMEVKRIDAVVRASGMDPHAAVWLPLVGRRSADWVAFVDPNTALILGYLPLDGFF